MGASEKYKIIYLFMVSEINTLRIELTTEIKIRKSN